MQISQNKSRENKEVIKTERKLKCVIRIFEDGDAEILHGKSLENFLKQESLALALLASYRLAMAEIPGKITWQQLEKAKHSKLLLNTMYGVHGKKVARK